MGRTERRAALFTALGILVSVAGRIMAANLQLPIWLDTVGTVFIAYVLGPVPGAVAGVSGNIIYAILNRGSVLYGLTSVAIGFIVGVAADRGYFKTLFGALTVGSIAALAATCISAPLSLILYDGYTGNMWGDGVFDLLQSIGAPRWISAFVGEFYLDFLDKVLTISLLYGAIRLYEAAKRKKAFAHGQGHDAADDAPPSADDAPLLSSEAEKPAHPAKSAVDAAVKVIVALLLVASALFCAPKAALAVPQSPRGEADFYSFVQETYSNENGLPCGEANDIAQTKDGIMWIGTYAGLYRYNGREFRLMSDFDSVKNVNCLYVDEEGRLWIGTNDKGLSMCVEEHVRNVIDTSVGLPSDSVRAIVRSSNGTYYVGTSDAMQLFELNGGIKLLDTIPEVTYAHSLSADERGNVAAVTSSGDLYMLTNGQVSMHATLDPAENAGVYTCCLFDRYGRLLVGTSQGVAYLYDISRREFKMLNKYEYTDLQEINSLYITEDGTLLACSDNGVGLFAVKTGFASIHTGSFNNSIDHMMVDGQGNYWFTSSRLGVLKMTRSTFSDLYEMAGIEREVVNATMMWRDLLYVGTDSGLDIINVQTGEPVRNELTNSLNGVRVRCLYVDAGNNLWICTYGKGLLRVTPDGATTVIGAKEGLSDRVRTCIQINDGTIIASADTCVGLVSDGTLREVLPYGAEFSSSQVLCFLQGSDGMVLSGTDGDGVLAMRDGKVLWRSTVKEGLSSNIVMRIVPTLDGSAYYVVTSSGLCLMQPDGRARLLENYPYFNNYDVQSGKNGELFVLSSAGIYVVDEKELLGGVDPLPAEILDAKSGLGASITANSWNCADSDGMLYIATDLGVFRLNTTDYAEGKRLYHMKISSVVLDGVEYKLERGTTFNIDQNASRMDINAEVISYTLDDPFVAYQLEGYDSHDTRVRKSELGAISYTNLGPGDYVFRLSVLGGDGAVLEEARYSLRKAPMIYDNAWFMIYVFVVAAMAIAWFTWLIARASVQRRLEQQRRELDLARRQIEMADQTVLSIARAVDAKDENTSQHSQRVSQYSVLLARELGFTEDECENLRKAALLHDIGKIGIPDRILNKPARLTDEEYAIMKTHVSRGADILKDFTMIDHVVEGALYHHERYDGRGYVNGLKGEAIPLYGRIIAVADAFDAMTQNRVYRMKQDLSYVLGELQKGKGSQFDPEIATIMLRLIDEGKIDHILYGPEGKPPSRDEEKPAEEKPTEGTSTEGKPTNDDEEAKS